MKRTTLALLVSLALAGCSALIESPATPAPDLPFPLAESVSWEYSSWRYENLAGQQSDATYSVVDKIINESEISGYLVFEVRRTEDLASSSGAWQAPSQTRSTYWYLVRGTHLYRVADIEAISEPSAVHLLYPFPVQDGLSWCPTEGLSVERCIASGKRTATAIGAYETPAGRFQACYFVKEDFTTQTSSQVFCPGVGIVHEKVDHNGAPFGFENTLVSLTIPKHQQEP